MDKLPSLKLSKAEIEAAFRSGTGTESVPAVLSVDQTASLLQVPHGTIYDWSSRGLLDGCARRVGKHLRIFRDRLIQRVFNEGILS